jgi:hypothetical protein
VSTGEEEGSWQSVRQADTANPNGYSAQTFAVIDAKIAGGRSDDAVQITLRNETKQPVTGRLPGHQHHAPAAIDIEFD